MGRSARRLETFHRLALVTFQHNRPFATKKPRWTTSQLSPALLVRAGSPPAPPSHRTPVLSGDLPDLPGQPDIRHVIKLQMRESCPKSGGHVNILGNQVNFVFFSRFFPNYKRTDALPVTKGRILRKALLSEVAWK